MDSLHRNSDGCFETRFVKLITVHFSIFFYVEEVLPYIVEVTAAKSQVACGIVDMLEVLEKGSISDVVLSPFWLLSFCLVLVIDLGASTFLLIFLNFL